MKQIRQAKEQFNEEVLGMKTRKEALLAELEDISLKLIDIQYRLDASKRKPVPTIPVIYPEEMHTDPFHVSRISPQFSWNNKSDKAGLRSSNKPTPI